MILHDDTMVVNVSGATMRIELIETEEIVDCRPREHFMSINVLSNIIVYDRKTGYMVEKDTVFGIGDVYFGSSIKHGKNDVFRRGTITTDLYFYTIIDIIDGLHRIKTQRFEFAQRSDNDNDIISIARPVYTSYLQGSGADEIRALLNYFIL